MNSYRGIDVYAAIPQIRQESPKTRFVVYVGEDTPAQRERCLAAGIHGMLVKVPSFTDTINAVCRVAREEYFFPPSQGQQEERGRPSLARFLVALTEREKEVLDLIVARRKDVEIAGRLSISLSTVISHKKNIYRKSGVKTKDELIRFLLEHGRS